MKGGDRKALYVISAVLCIAMCQGINVLEELLERAKQYVDTIDANDRYYCETGADSMSGETVAMQQYLANGANSVLRQKTIDGFICTYFSKYIRKWKKGHIFSDEQYSKKKVRHFVKERFPKCTVEEPQCPCENSFRTADGSCNNLKHPTWGQSGLPFRRLLKPHYGDKIGSPRRGKHGQELPNVRMISNCLFAPEHEENRTEGVDNMATVYEMQWGQFLDHDTDLTPVIPGANGTAIDCCACEEGRDRTETCFSIDVAPNDPHFGPLDVTCLAMVRSMAADQCPPAKREQVNAVTSYIDASQVYGSKQPQMDGLREVKGDGTLGAKLKTVEGKVPGYPMLPNGLDAKCMEATEEYPCKLAGDGRVNVNGGLTTLHTTSVREHNRYVMALAEVHPNWSDEHLFQTARKIFGAVMQHITYNEYLPLVLGDEIMSAYGLVESSSAFNNVYDRKVDSSTVNSFATAAFRFGHGQIRDAQDRLYKDYSIDSHDLLEKCFHKPKFAQERSNVDGMSVWMTQAKGGLPNSLFAASVRNGLFLDKATKKSLDLAAINMQRGRDHGLPGYNSFRKFCGLRKFKRRDIHHNVGARADHTLEIAKKLKDIYNRDKDIDLYAGAMTEDNIPGAHVGPTFACLIGMQFHALKFGDRYYFENENPNSKVGFTAEQVMSIKGYSLAKAVCMNHGIESIQTNIFKQADPDTNPWMRCGDIPDIDFSKF